MSEPVNIHFFCSGERIRAWHFAPASDALRSIAGSPAIVMGHGYGLTRDCGLAWFARAFAAAGVHVVLFDYRGFGDSEGHPRDVPRVDAQVEDYGAAIAAARRLSGVDPSRVAVWGTSYSGGIALVAAAQDGRVAAAVAQVPNLDNRATLAFLIRNTPPRRALRLTGWIIHDGIRALLRRPPAYVKAVGTGTEAAAYVSDEAAAVLEEIRGPGWANQVAMRDFLRPRLFRPVTILDRLPCRVLFVTADKDDLTPVAPTVKAARSLGPRAELRRYPVGHFGVYVEPLRSEAIADQSAFLASELAPEIAA
ncbi:MAG: alpha/beta fold hydrolase [Solirubrobacteraceae bacterium]|nr:alpha/beta fold hydrolase [Solirubrobacteraceae bacterium]